MDGFGDEQHTKDWSFDGVYTRYHNHSYTNGDRWSSTNTSEFSPINRPRLIKIVTFWLTLLLLGLICVSIYLANIRETKTRYYISQGKLAILQEFTTALGNKDSMEYKSLTANFCNQMDKTFRKSRSYTSSYRMCVVTNLRPGSVIVTFTLYFDATVDVSDNAVLTAINASIQQVDSKQMLGNYPIDVNELSVTTTLTLYKQDPLTFVEPNSDFIIPPTTKQTTTSTAVTSTSAIPATITTALPPVDTSETTSTTTSSIETTKVTILIPTTETTKSTTTMPKTTTAETTTKSHTEPSTSRNTISLTSTTEPKSTPLPSTVTTTIQMTTATEGTTSSQTSPTTTITSSSLAPTVTTKPTTTIGLSTTNQHTKTTTFVPTTTTETTTSTTSPPSSTTKATTTLPFSSSTETKTTSTLSLITTVGTTSLSPTTTEAKTTTTFSPSTTAKQTTSTMTPTLTSEVTITATSSPVVTSQETTLTNTTREDMTEATATRTTSEDTTGEVTTEATTDSTTTAAVTNSIREDITTALVTNTTKEVTTELTITNTTSDYTTQVTLNTTREYTTELMVTNTTREVTTEPTFTNTTREVTTEPTFTNTTREVTTEPTFTNTTREVTTEPTFTNTTREVTTEPTFTNTTREVTTEPTFTNTTREVTTDTTVVDTSEYTSGTLPIATTMSPFTADLNFPSKKILAREDTTLECVIKVTDQWEKVTINQETENDYIFLAEFYNNGSLLSHVTSEFLSVVFQQNNETIETIIHIHIQNMSSCPSLLYFACGITMEDTFKSVITKTSTLSITAPLHNVTLDMTTVYYSGERLELICRTITDFEYGEVALEVRSLNGLVHREPAPRTKYASTRNSDCSVEFEWRFKSSITLDSSMNSSAVRCIASNRLLNTSVSTLRIITVLVSDVSFSQYYVPGSVGKQVTIECKTNTLTPNIAKMAVYKTLNGTNETIASYSSGNTNSISDVSVTFQSGVLTLKFLSLKCSDEGLYICVVTSGSSEVSSPLSLTLQPTVLAGSTAVSLSLNTDIVENYYRYTSEHSCSGEIGYPDAGFLSLTAIHPTSEETVVYNEEVVTDAMKVKDTLVGSDIYNFGVTLAENFRILVREDRKEQRNCSTIHKIRFFLNVSREWSRGSFRCEVRTKEGKIPTSEKEEQFYVIPGDVCDAYNKTKSVFIDHDKNDNCNTYVECGGEAPYGRQCPNPKHCVFIGKDYCDECVRAICTEIPTTTARPVLTTEAPRGFSYLDCNSSSVYDRESANIGCHLNSPSFVSLNISRSDFTIAYIQADGSVIISPNYQEKFSAIFSLSSFLLDVTIHSVTCSDDGIYTVTSQLDSENITSTTFTVSMKVKPTNPSLTLNPNLVDGENSESHICTGNVGNPPGSLQIQIMRSSDSNFTNYSTLRQLKSRSTVNAGNCSFIERLSFSIDLTTDSWSNVTIRCVALNSLSLTDNDPVPSSILYTITSISSEFCENKNATYYDYHPMGCPFYVWCVKGRPYGQVCAAKNLCINPVSEGCV